ncbi:MAG: hypothetical protein ABGY72_09990, partial [bacterium]
MRHRVAVVCTIGVLSVAGFASLRAYHADPAATAGGRPPTIGRLLPHSSPALGAAAARRVPRVPAPRVRAQAAIIFDPVTGETLWERNSRELRSIASITKVMTVMLFLEQEPDLSRDV